MKSSNIGGQAVMEGIMMKSGDDYAVAVRKPDKEIAVKVSTYSNFIKKHKTFFSLPIVRGVFNFVDSLVLGMSCLTWSANFALEDAQEEESGKFEKALDKATGGKTNDLLLGLTVVFSIVMSVAIFIMLPYFMSTLLRKVIHSTTVITLLEGVLRLLIFTVYLLLISQMKDIQESIYVPRSRAQMHQLRGARHGSDRRKCHEEFQTPQTLWHQFPADRYDHQCDFLPVYPGGISGMAGSEQASADSGDCRRVL